MTTPEPYGSPAATEAAIREAARRATTASPGHSVSERIRLEYFHRFLSRIFHDEENSGWMLKGGTSILARVAGARSTTDVDMARRGGSLDDALADLRQRAAIDLGDHFRFEYTGHSASVTGDQQVYAEGYQVTFDIYLGVARKGSLRVDLVANVTATDEPEMTTAAGALDLPRLRSSRYRLYPLVDQVADKVCATLALYGGTPSTREKDLVDLVVIATTHDIESDRLARALQSEAKARGLTLPTTFRVPTTWGARYAKLALPVPSAGPFPTVESAQALMADFLDPVLSGSAGGKRWDHELLDWV